ncbi:hypothetical protein BB561_002687 [Smittium simulii]|uniref:Uncharacterized protein n=1 Tax=Smittium simulii TaxID=133385 RepID=A0A2T9YPI6_9FUNG|nr:hypothetical protein BB561_002687 [Smittium simulii]
MVFSVKIVGKSAIGKHHDLTTKYTVLPAATDLDLKLRRTSNLEPIKKKCVSIENLHIEHEIMKFTQNGNLSKAENN